METFWGHSNTFWTGVSAISSCIYTTLVTVTLWFIYRQVHTAAKSFQLEALIRLQQLVDDFREDRRTLFTNCPLSLALTHQQFAKRPPGRHRMRELDAQEVQMLALTEEQADALRSIDGTTKECARRVIARFNDIGQLIEDGFVNRRVFLGKYHVMVIQCCHLIEAIRREEEAHRGGNYGQRLLRMRHWATTYNDAWPKHRKAPIEITTTPSSRLVLKEAAPKVIRREIYRSPSPDVGKLVKWFFRRQFSYYD